MLLPQDSHVVILGPARDVQHVVKKIHGRLSKSFSDFRIINFIYLENFSRDKTWNQLSDVAAQDSRVTVVKDSTESLRQLSRPERLGVIRNQLLSLALSKFPQANYIVMADMDGVNLGLTRSAVMSNFRFRDWAAITANQPGGYYDIFALRHEYWNSNDCWQAERALAPIIGKKNAHSVAVQSKAIRIDVSTQPFQVQSAFGGLAIYRAEFLMDAKYSGIDGLGVEICEHIPFHDQILSNGGKIFINPAFVNQKPLHQFFIRHSHIVRKVFRG